MSQSNEKTTNNEIEDGEIIVESNISPNKLNVIYLFKLLIFLNFDQENESKKNFDESDSEEEQDSSHFFQNNQKKAEIEIGKEKNKEKEKERSRSREFNDTKNNLSNNNIKFNGKKILNNKKEICRFFAKGWCKNGENCNFLHVQNPCRYYNTLGMCTNKNCK